MCLVCAFLKFFINSGKFPPSGRLLPLVQSQNQSRDHLLATGGGRGLPLTRLLHGDEEIIGLGHLLDLASISAMKVNGDP